MSAVRTRQTSKKTPRKDHLFHVNVICLFYLLLIFISISKKSLSDIEDYKILVSDRPKPYSGTLA